MYLLALIEICQRFAFWGVGYLLVLFLVKHFSYSTPKATHIYGIYLGIAFTLPILGGAILPISGTTVAPSYLEVF